MEFEDHIRGKKSCRSCKLPRYAYTSKCIGHISYPYIALLLDSLVSKCLIDILNDCVVLYGTYSSIRVRTTINTTHTRSGKPTYHDLHDDPLYKDIVDIIHTFDHLYEATNTEIDRTYYYGGF